MQLIAINSSYRGDKGHTKVLLDHLCAGACSAGAEFKTITLAKHEINRCLACGECHTAEHYLSCLYADKDDTHAIFRQITCALCVTKSGLFFHHVDEKLCSKPFVSLIVCDNLDAEMPKNVRDYFPAFSRFMDAPHVGELIRCGGRLFAYGQHPAAAERFPRINAVYAAYEQAGRELALTGFISSSAQRIANQEIIPVPLFGLLKRWRPFKNIMVQKARELLA